MKYNRCGNSGLLLPALSLGLWHNFGHIDNLENARNILRVAFDNGITHFDLANNYGPPAGSAEENFGKIFQQDFIPYRDELVISTKAFAERTGIVFGLPMTHSKQHATNPFAIEVAEENGEVGYVLINQPKSFDWRARMARPHVPIV